MALGFLDLGEARRADASGDGTGDVDIGAAHETGGRHDGSDSLGGVLARFFRHVFRFESLQFCLLSPVTGCRGCDTVLCGLVD